MLNDEATKVRRCHPSSLEKTTIEVRQVREPRFRRNDADRPIRFSDEHARPADPQPPQILADIFAEMTDEQPVQRSRGEIARGTKIPDPNRLCEPPMQHVEHPRQL